jgi:predicted RNA-binding protein with RPS1 domain
LFFAIGRPVQISTYPSPSLLAVPLDSLLYSKRVNHRSTMNCSLSVVYFILPLLLLALPMADAFSLRAFQSSSLSSTRTTRSSPHRRVLRVLAKQELATSRNDDITWLQDRPDDDENDEAPQTQTASKVKSSRWDSLNPSIKARIVQAGQERAVANKKKREPANDKKRRMMMFMKTKQQEKKKASKVKRPLSFNDRTPLSALISGMETTGIVISLTRYGAYVDIGTECDGLLHISQLSNTRFVEHPRQVLTPGDEITVRIRSTNAELKKLHLTMLPQDVLDAEAEDKMEDRIPLGDIQIDDELWGELRRVTDYGAYVEVGAEVDGWLHFMDHPAFGWSVGSHPSKFMTKGERVRVWVADVDQAQRRMKLTANRPKHLPGPRRDL